MKRRLMSIGLFLTALTWMATFVPAKAGETLAGTFSVVARDSLTGEIGVAVQSKAFNVGANVAWAEAGVGAVATQAQTNRSFGPRGLELLRQGKTAPEVVEALLADDELAPNRQLAVVDSSGLTATRTGSACLPWAGTISGRGYCCLGNILASGEVVTAMSSAMRDTEGELADRLLAALEAGQEAGGDRRGKQSAAILIVRPSAVHEEYNYRYLDLRVEDNEEPIKELRRLYQIAQGSELVEAHMEYAEEYDEMGDLDLARREYELVGSILSSALARGEKNPGLLNNMAWAVATHDLYLEEARQAAEVAVEGEPENPEIIDTLAEVYFRQGMKDKAIEVEERALALSPESGYLKEQLDRFREGP